MLLCRIRAVVRDQGADRAAAHLAPDAHVEAPTAGSVILAGVLLKMGTLRLHEARLSRCFPDATPCWRRDLRTLAVASILYGACLALVQTDIKKIIAYSSISHLGYVMLGTDQPRFAQASRAR
jgi:NADH-quinone oxidoreductase subunit M